MARSLTKSSASLVAAGGDLAEAAALTATANAIIQDADSVGTALKTTSLRLRGTSVKVLEEEGLDSDGAIESTSKLRSQVLATSGVDILTDSGAYKSTYQILLEIAEVWDQITDDKARAGLLELLAGKRNSSVIAALLQNPEDLKAAYEDAMDAEGSALKENEKYLDSIQGKIDQFNNAMQAMWSNALDSDWVKDIVDFGTKLIKVIDKIGLLNTALITIATISMVKHKTGPIAFFKGIIEASTQGMTKLTDYAKGLKNVSFETGELSKAKTTLTQAQLKEKLTNTGLTDSVAEEIVAKTNLGKATDELNASTLDATLKEAGYSKEKRKSIVQSVFDTQVTDENTQANKENAASNMTASAAEDKNTYDTQENIATTKQDTQATKENTQANQENAASNVTLGQKIKNLGSSIGNFIKQNAASFIAIAGTILTVVLTKAIDALTETMDEANEKFEDLNNELKATKSELENLESQLEDVNSKIEELEQNSPLSFVDQEELARLRTLSVELERQIDITDKLRQQQQKGVNEAAIDTADKYKKTGVNSGKTVGERTGNAAKISGGIGLGATTAFAAGTASSIIAAGGTIGATNFWNPVGWVALAAAAVTLLATGITAAVASAESQVGDSMENMREEHEKLQKKYEKKRQKFAEKGGSGRRKRMEKASEELAEYESMMAEHFAEMDQYYSSIDLSVYDEVKDAETIERLRTEMNEFYDTRDKWLIQSGGANAKSNAISRIFGENASQELKDIKKEIQDALKAGEEFNFNGAFDEDFKRRLHDMGLTVTDVKYYFQDLKKAEDEAAEFTTDDAIKAVANLADKVESLKGAFEEFNETGIVTAKTLVELSETFGGMGDKWTDFVTLMTSGTASTEEAKAAINDLIETLITSALAGEKIETEQYVALWSQLTNMGVNNASELLNGIKEYSSIGEQIANEVLNNEKTIEEAIAEYEKANNVLLTAEQKQVIAATYDAKSAQKKADTYNTQIETLKSLTSEYQRAKEAEDEWEEEVDDAENTKSGRALGFLWKTQNKTDKERETNAVLNEEAAEAHRKAIAKQIKTLYSEVFGEEGTARTTDKRLLELQTYFEDPKNYDELSENAQSLLDELGDKLGLNVDFEFEDFDTVADKVQSVYSTLKDITTEYNTQGYLSLDNLQALLNLSPEYLAVLKMEGGQLTINQSALQAMLETKLADAEATAVQTAITQLNALAERKKALEISNSAVAANQAAIELGTYSGTLNTVAQDAIVAAGSVAAFNAALQGAQDNEFVKDEEWQQILTNYENTVSMIDSVRQNLPTNFNQVLDPGSKTTEEEQKDTWLDDQMEKFQKEMDYWENRIGANQARYEQLQNEIDLLEAKGQKADASYYDEQIKLENERRWLLEQQRGAASSYLAMLEEGSEEWWEVANTLNDIEGELDDVTASIVDLQDAIGEIDTYKFEEFNNRLDDITSKLGTIRDLIAPDEEDWFNDQGEWTEEGVAVLGTYIQELETYKNGLAEVNAERAKYNKSYQGNEGYYESLGIHSEQEYYDKVQELTEQQYDYMSSISDTEQSVVDMYESSIDAVEEYTESLIDSYNDYIDSVKEALEAERDLYDFKKNVQKQSKDIAAIERRIASLSGSTNASDVAERRKLEAELYESRESLNDTYYDHARSAQDEALDAEAAAYEETMTKFIEGLRVSLDQATTNMDEFLMGVTSMVMYNADTVLTKYRETNLPLTDELTNPWIKAKEAVGTYSGDALALMNKWTEEGGFFAQFNATGTKNLQSPWSAGSTAAGAFKTSVSTVMEGVVSNISTNVKTASGELSKLYQQIKDTEKRAAEAKVVVDNSNQSPTPSPSTSPSPSPTPEPTVKLRGLMKTSREMILGSKSFVDANTETINGVKYYRDSKTGYYYKISDLNSKRKYDGGRTTGWAIPKGTWFYTKHAKGTTGTTRDQWAITDEPQFGDELVLVPGKDGNLSFMRKGTGVVPADMTQKLFELAQIPTSDLMNKNLTAIVPNITKNDFKNEFNFESLVHVDTVDSDTLPKLEKMVDKKIDDFSRALNYSLKKFAR